MADRETLIQLYGTAEPPPAARRLVAGKLSFEIADGVVCNLCWNGSEVLRAIDYPTGRKLPELALALETGWEPATALWPPVIAPATLLRVDLTAPDWPTSLKRLVAAVERHAIEVLEDKAEPQPSGADNLKTLAMALAAHGSASCGKTIELGRWKEA